MARAKTAAAAAKPAAKATDKRKLLCDALNDLRARELGVVMQYMRQHYIVTGPDGVALGGEFKEVAIAEMKHAEELAERINFLGGDPTTKPSTFDASQKTFKDMAKADADAEVEAIALYMAGIKLAAEVGDVTTRKLLEDILGEEEGHLDTFNKMLGK